MNIKDIPVRVLGPGSQPDDGETLSYISMPSDMHTFSWPHIPDPEDVDALHAARDTMLWLRGALAPGDSGQQLANLSALDDASRELVNQILGEGEVSVTCDGPVRSRTQESVLAGVWRTLYEDPEGRTVADILEVADVPHVVRTPRADARPIDTSADDVPEDVMNALPILTELESAVATYRETGAPHVVNLTLLPLSEADVTFLDERLGRGAVDILSRSYGRCQVISTLTDDVWWVRYYNSMGTLILNTLEVIDVPQVVCAAPEDIHDSGKRLEDILAPYWSEVA